MICELCFHHCDLSEGQAGFCRARACRNGAIVPLNYGKLTSLALDPIEKKPLRRFHPGSRILSVGSFGCNLSCPFCQNHEISMCGDGELATVELSPEALAGKALELRLYGNIGAAYTYNEPLIGYEYVRDCATLIHKRGMVNVLVTNGTAFPEILNQLIPYIDAMNIDLKGFTQEYYKKLGGDLEIVKTFIVQAAASCHVELTTLVVPGENDSPEEMEKEARWIASVGKEIPLHVTRFFPRYHMRDREATEIGQVYQLAEVARRYLDHVFVGNC